MFESLIDKRFSFRFRILNFLSGDILRNYLAVGVGSYLKQCDDILTSNRNPDIKLRLLEYYTQKARDGVEDIYNL